MDKREFLRRLKEDLTSLTDEEIQGALKYYDEYFADAHEASVEQQITDYNIMEDLKEETASVEIEENVAGASTVAYMPKVKKNKSMTAVVLLICFSPVLVPLAIAAASAMFALLMAFLSVTLAIGCAAIAGFIAAGAGVFSIGYGIVQLIVSGWYMSDGLYLISTGLMGTGVGIILAYLFGKLAFLMFKYEFKFIGFIGRKIFRPAHSGI